MHTLKQNYFERPDFKLVLKIKKTKMQKSFIFIFYILVDTTRKQKSVS